MSDNDATEKLAAGGVVIESGPGRLRVLVVHRPRYNDWSFPKGGVKVGESLEEAALREVREETGLDCAIVRKLSISRYNYRSKKGIMRPKSVHYFLMEAVPGQIITDGIEVDEACWLDIDRARDRLTYVDDRRLLDTAAADLAL